MTTREEGAHDGPKIGIMTCGGDCPGPNAVIRAMVQRADPASRGDPADPIAPNRDVSLPKGSGA